MRDVTDNVTGELPGVEHKRGRGRPRKAHAMTNAERQAAFRARRKAQQPVEAKSVTKRMTVTEMLSDVDAYDECRVEVDSLRAELADMKVRCARLQKELDLTIEERGKAYDLADFKEDQRQELVDEIAKLKAAQKSVTQGNEKGPTVGQWLALLKLATKGKAQKARNALFDTAEYDAVSAGLWEMRLYHRALRVAVIGEKVVEMSEGVTPKS
ncbi:hypothetical protein [Ralstonia wenshanensis]|uniref:Uncharacterized protein n=1 Tax=Ralstonia wenshanensis TaxID=2842456 RepID=A0AAD2B785_9RALS|nr:hypothetical protein [Ralstonia wenshanensis]CAJ0702493.1 hypothetical protein LMG18091_03698 [Ralstonia wenshanensis]